MMDIINMILSFMLAFFIPGYGLSLILFRELESIPIRFILSVALSIFLTSAIGILLAGLQYFYVGYIWITLSMIAIVSLATSILLSKRAISRDKKVRSLPDEYVVGNYVILGIIIAFILMPHLFFAYGELPVGISSWRYLADAMGILKNNGIPNASYQWGQFGPIVINKISFNIFTAALLGMSNIDTIPFMQLFRVTAFILVIIAAWIFYKELFNFKFASIAMLLTFANLSFARLFIWKFNAYKAESFGMILFFVTIWATYIGLIKKRRQFLILPAILMPVLATIHGVPATVALLFILSLSLAKWIKEKRIAIKEFLLVSLLVISIISGTLLIWRVTGQTLEYQESIIERKAYSAFNGIDPTIHFLNLLGSPIPPRPISQGLMYHTFQELNVAFYGQIIGGPFKIVLNDIVFPFMQNIGFGLFSKISLPLFTFLILLLLSIKLKNKDGVVMFSFTILALAIYAMAICFSLLFHTYIPAEHVIRRESQYIELTLVIATIYILRLLSNKVSIKLKSGLNRTNINFKNCAYGFIVALLILIIITYPINVRPYYISEEFGERGLSWDGYRALQWIHQDSGGGAFVLTNIRTTGTIDVIANSYGIAEGRATYLEATLLERSLFILESARAFYEDPEQDAILSQFNIDYILIAPPSTLGGQDYYRGYIDLEKFNSVEFLEPVARFGDIFIYKVVK